MKIGFLNNSISFQKHLVAKAGVMQDKKTMPIEIYKLDFPQDKFYVHEKLVDNASWSNSYFARSMDIAIKSEEYNLDDTERLNVYSAEKDGECLGLMETYTNDYADYEKLSYIETCPDCSSKNKERNVKYIGQTLISFLAKLIEDNGENKTIYVPYVVGHSRNFYDKCGFQAIKNSKIAEYLEPDKYKKLIKTTEKKTKSQITLINDD